MMKPAWMSIIIGTLAAGLVQNAQAAAYTIQTFQFSTADKFTDVVGVTNSGLLVGNAAKSSSSSSSIFTGSTASGPFTTFNPTGFTNVEALSSATMPAAAKRSASPTRLAATPRPERSV
jgi:hypothetical protein